MSESDETQPDDMPDTDQLQKPSTEKDPGEEPKDAHVEPDEVDHEAVGIGVIDTPDSEGDSPGE
ncbi:hypothetical protein [Gryllotalpicola koreensis]|uniref:Uncharacterized protein n=1 Tax=Gryllotalpicola koreensis TaxID=993086 RepID=A0ABP8A0K5_9MICO